jgi:hypothetical protein
MSHRLLLILPVAVSLTWSALAAEQPKPSVQCSVGNSCMLEGQLIATQGTGSVRYDDSCVAVALPQYVTDSWNLQTVKASGTIYKALSYPGLVTYQLLGRKVDAEACYSGLVMYVDRIEKVTASEK